MSQSNNNQRVEEKYYVYGHYTKDTGVLFYIGVGTVLSKSNKEKSKYSRAYHFRNRQIVMQSDLKVAFLNGYSTGTKYTINFAKTLEKEVIVVKY